MVVKTNWPGATAREVEQQVTDRIERKLQEVAERRLGAQLLEARRVARVLRVQGLGAAAAACRRLRTRCARRSATSATRCPPASRDRSSTTSSATPTRTSTRSTGDGFGYRELKEFGDRVRAELLRVPGVAKVDFIGEQDEKIFVELSNAQARDARHRARADRADARGAERGRRVRRVRHGDRPHLRAADRRVRHRSTRSATSRSAPNNRVFRLGDIADGHARLRRPAAAEDALAGPARRSASASRW